MSKPILRLYISGNSPSSWRAVRNLQELQLAVAGGWQTEIIDVAIRPDLAEQDGILATPTLCYAHPQFPRRIIGDLGDTKRVLDFLGAESKRRDV